MHIFHSLATYHRSNETENEQSSILNASDPSVIPEEEIIGEHII